MLNRLLLNLYGSLGLNRASNLYKGLGLNRASNLYRSLGSTVYQWLIFQNCIKHAYKSSTTGGLSCLLYPSEHGSLGIDCAVEGSVSASPRWKGLGTLHSTFSGKYGGIDLGRHHHNLVTALNLIYSCTCHGLL